MLADKGEPVTARANRDRSAPMPITQRSLTLMCVAAASALLIAACGDDDDEYLVSNYGPLVGGPCLDSLDCVSGSFCADSSDFPDGTCTAPCDDHGDCPGPSLCIERERGACLLFCRDDRDCRRDYKCKEVKDQRGNGRSRVCIK